MKGQSRERRLSNLIQTVEGLRSELHHLFEEVKKLQDANGSPATRDASGACRSAKPRSGLRPR